MNMEIIRDIFERLSRDSKTEIDAINRNRGDKGDVPFIIIDKNRQKISAAEIITDFEKTQPAPFRRKGQHTASSVLSLLSWMTANTPADAPIFGVGLDKLMGQWRLPKLAFVGIGNYSTADKASWHDFKVRYDFPVSHAWTIWAAKHSEDDKAIWFKQEEFAEFIESRIYDLSSPASRETLSEAVSRFIEISGKKDAATPSEMFKISRELRIMSESSVEAKIDLQSGEAKLKYSEEHTGPGGHPIKIPSLFYIRIPVFFGQDPVLIGVKLRYRATGGSVSWCYSLFAPEIIVADEFEKACAIVKTAGRTLYLGEPD